MERTEFQILEKDKKISGNIFNPIEEGNKAKKLILACHGFDSSKDSSSIVRIAEEFEGTNIPIVSFNWPGHGDSEEEITLERCFHVLRKVEEKIEEDFPNADVYLYGSSFGGYMILQYLQQNLSFCEKKIGKYIFLKSPAIKMNEILQNILIDESMDVFQNRGYTIKDRNKRMVIPYRFYEELCENRIDQSTIKSIKKEMIIFHGTSDETASFQAVLDLKSDHVEIYELKNAEHSFKGVYLDEMARKMKEIIQNE